MISRLIAAAFVAFFVATTSFAASPVRLDASSDQAARASLKRMLETATPPVQQALVGALIKINLAGAESARDMVENPELQRFGIVRIKDKVSGMTAPEIIELGNKVSAVKIKSIKWVDGSNP